MLVFAELDFEKGADVNSTSEVHIPTKLELRLKPAESSSPRRILESIDSRRVQSEPLVTRAQSDPGDNPHLLQEPVSTFHTDGKIGTFAGLRVCASLNRIPDAFNRILEPESEEGASGSAISEFDNQWKCVRDDA
jgi:hypothetical protein